MIKEIKLDKQTVLSKFLNNGHHLSPASFQLVMEYLALVDEQAKLTRLNQIIKKINEMAILSTSKVSDKVIEQCLISLEYKNGKMNYIDILNQKYKNCLFAISPYEYCTQDFFISKPNRSLFEFHPQQKVDMHLRRFKKLKTSSVELLSSDSFIGVLFERFDTLDNKNCFYLQNESTEIKINLDDVLPFRNFLIAGCTYIAKGKYLGKDLLLSVKQMILPSFTKATQDLARKKFEQSCKIADQFKENSHSQQFIQKHAKLGVKYFTAEESKGPCIIFGNITLNHQTIKQIESVIEKLGTVKCIFLMLNSSNHSVFDLKSIKAKVYIVPHLNSPGPQLVPKIPISKFPFTNCEILTNPCRLTMCGKNLIFANYSLASILTMNNLKITNQKLPNDTQLLLPIVAQFIFSQCNVSVALDTFWQQNEYLDVYSDNFVFVSDVCCSAGRHLLQNTGAYTSVGHFDREKNFIVFYPSSPLKDSIQPSQL